jgi:methyltransferase
LEKQLIKKGDDYATLDFRDPKSQRELTVALLKHDFNLSVDIPLDKLIPTVPQKLNYIHWIEDLLAGCNNGCIPRGPEVVGIDVGTGASCVYPLLGHTINGWVFMATEIEPLSVDFARENVEKNGLQQSIEVCHVDQSTFLVGALKEGKKYNFSMCNPPFYPEDHDLHGSCSHGDRPPACSINTGQPHETATVGGEEVFVQKLIDDSLCLRDQVRWYTTMLGKKSSVKKIKAYLKDKKVPMVTSTEFIQGKTRRWGLAWSFVQSVKVPGKTQSSAQRSCYKAVLKKSSAEMGCPKGTSPLTKYASVRFEALLDRLEVSSHIL